VDVGAVVDLGAQRALYGRNLTQNASCSSTRTIVSAATIFHQHHERSASWHQRLLFCTKPEAQPLDHVTCRVLTTPRPAAAREGQRPQVSVYATNYNVLRIMSGWVGSHMPARGTTRCKCVVVHLFIFLPWLFEQLSHGIDLSRMNMYKVRSSHISLKSTHNTLIIQPWRPPLRQ
jgi:hypothetical protein